MTEWLTVSQAAHRTGRCAATIRLKFDAGEISGVRTANGHRIINAASLDAPEFRDLTISGAARRLGKSADTVRRLLDDGLLNGYRTDAGHRRVVPDSIDAYLKKEPG